MSDPPEKPDQRHSSFRLEISIAIGYQRKRALLGGKWEGPVVTLALLVAGIAIVFLIFWRLGQISL